ncbi:STE18 (YJR086W) [Zygosaccharomyces parabailii]|uniref:ZYBA0S06-04324g1_1 n=1 Tax=Zygosaccharomyces bailii (strain CLIB 213 / ATCC 58445 / CBS 680 / BCRC 21525 / NBRC 1098 / NCYC 1416 / NRRL Y-2227) TaxID=1333698 RepID=A0A8J2X9B0_ZYGB2|nr:STE18 (YJR086W) [Zygosaccharomyces parabailii]CDF90255.1 ZYBA0S06-04324g1_1 [Zygosaccharomyces bailii CLIB 213]CDH11521.1 related to Guanine nucleotide-binding protein subunit gamma [Zygosaccharomyces bailii ISA1307]SJM84611.1 related to Guanine nucleotide-binding protein subunit gamma [Zygosaccharomyces bailii]
MNHDEQLSLKIKYLKLKRVNGLNNKLRGELSRERITASNACLAIVNHVSTHRDYAIPDIWGYPKPGTNHFREGHRLRADQASRQMRSGSGASHGDTACCSIM